MAFLQKLREAIVAQSAKLIIAMAGVLLLAITTLLHGALLKMDKELLVRFFEIVLYLVLVEVAIIAYYWNKTKRPLTFHCGVLWSKDLVPHCPKCEKPLGRYDQYGTGLSRFDWGFMCIHCEKVFPLFDEVGRNLQLQEAKRKFMIPDPQH